MVLGHVRRVELGQDLDFLLDVLDLILCTLQVNDLDRDRFLSTLVVASRPSQIGRVEDDRGRATYPLYTSPKEPLPDFK